jgi:hypothetical protein
MFFKVKERKMRKTMFMMAVLTIGMVGTTQAVDLIAGQHMVVGSVEVEVVTGPALHVEYLLDVDCEDVELLETHLHVASNPPGTNWPITNKGNPRVGKFEYSGDTEYTIPLADIPGEPGPGDTIYIAAHAVTGTDFCSVDELPGLVTGDVDWDQSLNTYFKITISGGTILDGVHGAWCADAALQVNYDPVSYTVVPSVPAEINCLLNNHYVGATAADGKAFTIGDVQLAIWILLDPALEDLDDFKAAHPGKAEDLNNWFGPYTGGGADDPISQAAHVQEILDDVFECEMVPGCCDVMGILLYPPVPLEGPLNQPVLIEIPAPCCETAWGQGTSWPGNNWAMYFTFVIPGS